MILVTTASNTSTNTNIKGKIFSTHPCQSILNTVSLMTYWQGLIQHFKEDKIFRRSCGSCQRSCVVEQQERKANPIQRECPLVSHRRVSYAPFSTLCNFWKDLTRRWNTCTLGCPTRHPNYLSMYVWYPWHCDWFLFPFFKQLSSTGLICHSLITVQLEKTLHILRFALT